MSKTKKVLLTRKTAGTVRFTRQDVVDLRNAVEDAHEWLRLQDSYLNHAEPAHQPQHGAYLLRMRTLRKWYTKFDRLERQFHVSR